MGRKKLERWRLERETAEDYHHHHHLAGTHGLPMRLCSKVACVEAAQWKGLAFKRGCLEGFRKLSFRFHRTPACSRVSLVPGRIARLMSTGACWGPNMTAILCMNAEKWKLCPIPPLMTLLRCNIIYLGPFREMWSNFPSPYIHISVEKYMKNGKFVTVCPRFSQKALQNHLRDPQIIIFLFNIHVSLVTSRLVRYAQGSSSH